MTNNDALTYTINNTISEDFSTFTRIKAKTLLLIAF